MAAFWVVVYSAVAYSCWGFQVSEGGASEVGGWFNNDKTWHSLDDARAPIGNPDIGNATTPPPRNSELVWSREFEHAQVAADSMLAQGTIELKTDDHSAEAAPPPLLHLTARWLPELIVEPNVATVIHFNVTAATGTVIPTHVSFVGNDYRGDPPGGWAPMLAPISNGIASLSVNRSVGYSEFRCTETNQTFGVVASPRLPEVFDDRFAVVAAFTQICNTAQVHWREPLLAMLARIGVGNYRDFPSMGLMRQNATAPYDWDHEDSSGLAGRMEQLHQLNRKLGLRVLDCFDSTTKWNARTDWYDGEGKPWRFPKALVVAADSFATVAAHWGDTQAGIEAYNEVDAMAYAPDQYAVLLKTIRWGLHTAAALNSSATLPPLVCGAFTDAVHSTYLDTLAQNQFADVCDAVSYHSYADVAEVQDDVARMRLWQRTHNASHLPLLITESGADFALRWNSSLTANPTGPQRHRPTLDQGRAYAFGDVAHQIENIAVGVDRTYAFNYVFYAESGHNYGMLGKDYTPLRAFADYATAVRFLSHKTYIGDLPNKDGAMGRGRVFANTNNTEIVAAVFAGDWVDDEFSGELQPETPPGPMWSWFMPILGAFGSDGRPVNFNCATSFGCQWGNYERLSWLTLGPGVLPLLDTPTVASLLHRPGARVGSSALHQAHARPVVPPVILQYVVDNNTVGIWPTMGSRIAYSVSAEQAAAPFNLTILVNNMAPHAGGEVAVACVACNASGGSSIVVGVPARGVGSASFLVDIAALVKAKTGGVGVVDITGSGSWGGVGPWVDRLSLNFVIRAP